MTRSALRGLVILAAFTLVLDTSTGQQAAPGKVYVRDKKDGSVKAHNGTLKLAPGGFQIVGTGDKVFVAPEALVKFDPGELPGVDRNTVLGLLKSEDDGDYKQARLGYAELQKKSASAPEASRRFVDFKLATMTTKVADASGDEEKWDELAGAAAKAWGAFLNEYRGSWEVWPATRTSARLLTELNKHDEVARLWGRTAKIADLPSDLKLEAGLRALDAEIRGGGFANVTVQAEALAKTTEPGPAKDKLTIYELAAKAGANKAQPGEIDAGIKKIEGVIAKSKDPTVRGVGYGMIGELHLLAGKSRDAMWAFLWVETVYSQDKDDVLKAMCRLVEVFRAQADEDRARSYREKLRRLREAF